MRISSDTLFGNILDNQGGRKPSNAESRVPTKGRNDSRKSFATTVSPVAIQTPYREDTRITATSNILSTSCPYRIRDHELTSCQHFNLQQHEKKLEFLKINGFCFGCLVRGYLSKSCKKRMT